MAVEVLKRKFTIDEYHRMAATGIFREDDRIELIDGAIFMMTPIGNRHAQCVRRLNRLFSRQLGDGAIIDVQNPLRLGEHSEPQPDLVLLAPRPDFYPSHPGPADVLLAVEVADTSAEYDRQVKLPVYARFGIREVWLIDLTADRIEIYRAPTPDGYQEVQHVSHPQPLSPQFFQDIHLNAGEILK